MDQFSLFAFSTLYSYLDQPYNVWQITNTYPPVQYGLQYALKTDHFSNTLPPIKHEEHISEEIEIQKVQKEEEKVVCTSQTIKFEDNQLKVQESMKTEEKDKTFKENNFQYYDPGQAPSLTFRMKDIGLRPGKNSSEVVKMQQLELNDFHLSSHQQKNIPFNEELQNEWQFHVTQPDPQSQPFLIIKKRPSKRRLLTNQRYKKRAQEIQKRRINNIHRHYIEEKIGKKLPVKNRKWQRKKSSLVFNSKAYKKKVIHSKNIHEKTKKIEALFTKTH